jgi:ABC-type siderophore export system fused ATPase/permease subunit
MPRLTRLHLTNCSKVSDIGILDVLLGLGSTPNSAGITDIALEGTSGAFDLVHFSASISETPLLASLHSMTLTAPPYSGPKSEHLIQEWFAALLLVLASCPLERLHIYTSGDTAGHSVPNEFVRSIADTHKMRLNRFSVHRMGVDLSAVEYLCKTCLGLEELFVTIADKQLVGSLSPNNLALSLILLL